MYETVEEYFRYFKTLPVNEKKEKWETVFRDMATHTRKRIPKESLLKRRPNEEDEIFQYRVANYRAITYGSMNKALDDVYRILNGISYTTNAPDNVKEFIAKKTILEYSDISKNETCSLELFLQRVVLKRMIEDPNGFLIWLPSGDGIFDSSTKVDPQPTLVLSEQFHYSDKNVFIWISETKTPLRKQSGEMVLEGELYFTLTKNEYWKLYQTGSYEEPTWVSEKIYSHNLQQFPVIVLGGEKNTEGYYESFFSPYLAFGDEAIHQFSDWQAIMTTSSFPKTEEFMTECAIEKYTLNSNNPSDTEEEFQGKGLGTVKLKPFQKGPYGKILRKVPQNNVASDDLDVSIPSIRYISPDIGIAKYSGESWEKLIEKAEQSLNIDMGVGVNQSGVAKQLDKESQYSMITKIGGNIFDNIFTNCYRIIDAYINKIPVEKSNATINKPSTFWVKNELDLINEITTLKASNAPSFFLAEATNDLAKKRFNGNPVNQKVFDFISLYDPYFIYTTSEKAGMLASTVMTKDEYIISIRMYSLLQQIVMDLTPSTFISTEMAAIKLKFDSLIKPFFPIEQTPQYDENGNLIP